MRESTVLRLVAGVVLLTFTNLVLQPAIAAAQLPSGPGGALPARAESPEERYSRLLAEMHELLKATVPFAAMPQARVSSTQLPPGVDMAATVDALRTKHRQLRRLEAEVDKSFQATEQHIKDKALPAEILARHQDAVAEYQRRKSEFHARIKSLENARQARGDLHSALAELGAFMAKHPHRRRHTHSDPNNLPWRSPKPVTRKPITTRQGFRTSGLLSGPVLLAQAGSLSGIGLPIVTLPATPTPEDTTPTEDVQITQAIRDLAASLGNQPVPIYNWVRNNIQFVPSYGSIQGSDMTLQTKRGNAFDTASLLIALLRAASIPARYVYGTIEVPADKVMNWVGGVTVPQAAQNLMGQGGIPNVGVALGGQIRSIRLEHVWVEAYVDYIPGRGAVNRVPNTWVPLDASFKQYQFTQGMDIKTNVPFDANSFVTQIQSGATVNEAEGWAQNVNQTQVQQALTNYQAQVTNFVNAQNPDATVGDVHGTQTVVEENRPILLGTLPYKRIATGAKFQTIPDNLRWKFRYNVYANDTDRAFDSPFITLERSTSSLAGKKITLSFSPATSADQATISSFFPQPHPDGTPIQPSEFPQSLPGYLIRLTPELRVDGQVVASGSTHTMGTELVQNAGMFDPARGWQFGDSNRPIAGEYIATALNLEGTSPKQISDLRSKLGVVRLRLQTQELGSLTKEDVSGDILFAAVLSYFAATDAAGRMASTMARVVDYVNPSFGNFSVTLQPRLFFGVPRSTSFLGVTMDIDRLASIGVAQDGSMSELVNYRRQQGSQLSAYEHLIPEKLFTPATNPIDAVSAVKALSIAAAQGQRIYTITVDNFASVLPTLAIGSDVKAEIESAVLAGREATVSEANITVNGWTGVGYIIVDPLTGAGAYKISGGANGAALFFFVVAVALCIIAPYAVFAVGATGGAVFVAALFSGLNLIGLLSAFTFLFSEANDDLLPEERAARLGMISLLSIASSFLAISNAGVPTLNKPLVIMGLLAMVTFLTGVLNRGA